MSFTFETVKEFLEFTEDRIRFEAGDLLVCDYCEFIAVKEGFDKKAADVCPCCETGELSTMTIYDLQLIEKER